MNILRLKIIFHSTYIFFPENKAQVPVIQNMFENV